MKTKTPPDFRKALDKITGYGSRGHRDVFDAFVRLAACALACETREQEYLEEAKRWTKEELEGFSAALAALVAEMEAEPFSDLIGTHYMNWALSQKSAQWNGEFHTPQAVCELMARMTYGDGSSFPKEGPITVAEPACGAGAQILALGKVVTPEVRRRLRVTAIDVNRTACDMTFINTTLWGIPCRVIHGNTLSGETWGAWSNLHYICPWLPLAMRVQTPEAKAQGQPAQPQEMAALKAAVGEQSAFDFIEVEPAKTKPKRKERVA